MSRYTAVTPDDLREMLATIGVGSIDELFDRQIPAGVRLDGDTATFGITWFAQDALGEVVFFDPPDVGTSVTAGESYAEVESVKAVSDVIAPLSGEIVEVNTALGETPETINDDPYGDGWMVKVRLTDQAEVDTLMDAASYEGMLA